jgi:hypothetical protein
MHVVFVSAASPEKLRRSTFFVIPSNLVVWDSQALHPDGADALGGRGASSGDAVRCSCPLIGAVLLWLVTTR